MGKISPSPSQSYKPSLYCCRLLQYTSGVFCLVTSVDLRWPFHSPNWHWYLMGNKPYDLKAFIMLKRASLKMMLEKVPCTSASLSGTLTPDSFSCHVGSLTLQRLPCCEEIQVHWHGQTPHKALREQEARGLPDHSTIFISCSSNHVTATPSVL